MELLEEQTFLDRGPLAEHHPLAIRLRNEERANCATHAVGLVLSVAAVVILLSAVARQGGLWQWAGCSIYGAALIAVYAASTLSHVFQRSRLRRLWRIIDQACIFLLIAGTYTPLALSYLRGSAGLWTLFSAIWAIALWGFFSKALFAHRVESVSPVLHVTLGWLPLAGLPNMIGTVPGPLLWWMFYGGVCYTLGTIFLHRDERVRYFHAVWHVLVIAGSACHFWGILQWCTAAT